MYIKLMADHCSTGIWDLDGRPLDLEEIDEIPLWLKNMITEWNNTYDRFSLRDDFDLKKFSEDGLALAVKLKQNTPDNWMIFYFDEFKAIVDSNEVFLFEVY